MKRVLGLAIAALIVLGACGGGEEGDSSDSGADSFNQSYEDAEVYPILANADLAVGPNRFLVGLNDSRDAPIGAPGVEVDIAFYDLDESASEPVVSHDTHFVWAIKPVVGIYATEVDFDAAGEWGAEFDISGAGYDETLKARFHVNTDSSTPAIGEKPPASENPTSDDVKDLSAISTDNSPDPRFYKTTVKDALAAGEPFVVIFATPKFCQSQTCGPMLDIFQNVAKGFPKLTFIHIEPYELPADPSKLQPAPTASEWGLPSEPWAFAIDSSGQVVAKFEGAVAPEEISSELKKLS
jgi:hypothetical protein